MFVTIVWHLKGWWNSLKTNTDDNFFKTEWANQRVYGHGWWFFDCWVLLKKDNTFKIGEKNKKGAMDQPCYNSSPIISDHVIMALQCIWSRNHAIWSQKSQTMATWTLLISIAQFKDWTKKNVANTSQWVPRSMHWWKNKVNTQVLVHRCSP